MSTDAKKHTSIAAGETPTRAALAAAILSISDVIPVANATEAAQVAAAIAATGQTLSTNPVTIARADARGLHRIEYSYDGTNWIPATGVVPFASKAAADTWAGTYGSLLQPEDRCVIAGATWKWSGTAWVPLGSGPVNANANPGVAIAGITVPNAAVSLPQGLLVKTGILTATTSTSFGNEYMPRVVFATAFPTSLLSVHIMQIATDGATIHPNAATDDAKADGFRVLYTGTTSTVKRSFMWTAFGY